MSINEPARSPLLVFGVGGRIGSGCSFVRDWLSHCLATFDYSVVLIDVTKVFLEQWNRYINTAPDLDPPKAPQQNSDPAARVEYLQACGNKLRKSFGNDIITALCVNEVIRPHLENEHVLGDLKRVAYIIDSIKHPAEVHFLRSIFRDAFCMVGVVASDRTRMKRLSERKGFDASTFSRLSGVDANEAGADFGQKAIDAVVQADYFFANDYATKAEIQGEAERLMRLLFGIEVQSPRRDEVGMQTAFKSALRSACLSRQVGAAILADNGAVLATGHNDVPQFGGGLYCPESVRDERCFARGAKCYNDEEKDIIVTELLSALVEAGIVPQEGDSAIAARSIIRSSRIKNLIEFSRAVHAETDAIISVARSAAPGLVGATLYCTTFPCHNCAKHIIDAGISRVVYLEPYEKSLARKLHSDAINDSYEEKHDKKVAFDIYGGVSPRRYNSFFTAADERKRGGRFLDRDAGRSRLLPLGAQEADVLQSRVDRVTKKVDEITQRTDELVEEPSARGATGG